MDSETTLSRELLRFILTLAAIVAWSVVMRMVVE